MNYENEKPGAKLLFERLFQLNRKHKPQLAYELTNRLRIARHHAQQDVQMMKNEMENYERQPQHGNCAKKKENRQINTPR